MVSKASCGPPNDMGVMGILDMVVVDNQERSPFAQSLTATCFVAVSLLLCLAYSLTPFKPLQPIKTTSGAHLNHNLWHH